jgi:hypothetical protein
MVIKSSALRALVIDMVEIAEEEIYEREGVS